MTLASWTLIEGDALDSLRVMGDGSAQCCITSPPYWGLRDYGVDGQLGLEGAPEEYVEKLVEVFREVRRVLRDDGTLWLNLGDSYSHGGNGSRDGERWPKQSRNNNGHRAPHSKKNSGVKPKDLVGTPWMVAFALRADGWYLRSEIIWAKPNPMPESVTDRPTRAHEQVFLLSKGSRYYYDAEAIREPSVGQSEHDLTGPPRLDIPGQSDQTGRRRSKVPDGWDTGPGGHGTIHREGRGRGHASEIRLGRSKRSVWTIAPQPYPEAHFATFPPKLIEPMVLAGCPAGGTILDPFAGSGTTLQVAVANNRRAIGIELNPEYADLVRNRMVGITPSMFDAVFV